VKTIVGEYVSKVPTQSEAVAEVHGSIERLPAGRWLLAVSGGRDSMVLLEAFAGARPVEIAAVATFNHGTGTAATKAARLVERRGLELGVPVVSGRLPAGSAHDEAAWRAARWTFLRGWAAELNARVVTAHTWNDQVETVLLRLLRGAGARGLAGMLVDDRPGAATGIARPFIRLQRGSIEDYAAQRRVTFIEDPSNRSLAFARNRVRHELLPALERAAPGFASWSYTLSERAADLRREVRAWVDAVLTPTVSDGAAGAGGRQRSVGVRAEPLVVLESAAASVVWPEVASRVGVRMDRRGIARVSAWAPGASAGGRIPLSGGVEILRTHSAFVLRVVY
jgi:tRNA(Ile)-lysidine synthase